jgi:hypothetical protein
MWYYNHFSRYIMKWRWMSSSDWPMNKCVNVKIRGGFKKAIYTLGLKFVLCAHLFPKFSNMYLQLTSNLLHFLPDFTPWAQLWWNPPQILKPLPLGLRSVPRLNEAQVGQIIIKFHPPGFINFKNVEIK